MIFINGLLSVIQVVKFFPHPAQEVQMIAGLTVLQSDKLMHLLHTGINLVVNQQVIIGFHTRRLLSGTAEPGIDDLNGLCSPAYQTVF